MYQELSAKVDKVSYNAAMNALMSLYSKCKSSHAWDPDNIIKYQECTNQISSSHSLIKENIHTFKLFYVNREKEMSLQSELEQILEDIELQLDTSQGLEQVIAYIQNSTMIMANHSLSSETKGVILWGQNFWKVDQKTPPLPLLLGQILLASRGMPANNIWPNGDGKEVNFM